VVSLPVSLLEDEGEVDFVSILSSLLSVCLSSREGFEVAQVDIFVVWSISSSEGVPFSLGVDFERVLIVFFGGMINSDLFRY